MAVSGDVMNNNREACDLARLLIAATSAYATYHISNQKNKFAYIRAMSRCAHMCSEHVSGNDMPLMKQRLIMLRYDVDKRLKKRWFSRENYYYLLSIEHAIEIIDCVFVRFVTGYSCEDKAFVTNLVEDSGDGHQICSCLDRFGKT